MPNHWRPTRDVAVSSFDEFRVVGTNAAGRVARRRLETWHGRTHCTASCLVQLKTRMKEEAISITRASEKA